MVIDGVAMWSIASPARCATASRLGPPNATRDAVRVSGRLASAAYWWRAVALVPQLARIDACRAVIDHNALTRMVLIWSVAWSDATRKLQRCVYSHFHAADSDGLGAAVDAVHRGFAGNIRR